MIGLIACLALCVAAWVFLLRKVRAHQGEDVETPEGRYAEIREAILRADEATVAGQERFETARMIPRPEPTHSKSQPAPLLRLARLDMALLIVRVAAVLRPFRR